MSPRVTKRTQRTSQDGGWGPGGLDAAVKQTRSPSRHSQQRSRHSSSPDDLDADHRRDQEFMAVGVGEMLELDPRPTFVLSLDIDFDSTWEPAFINASLLSDRQLLKLLPFKAKFAPPALTVKGSSTVFSDWVKNVANSRGTKGSSTLRNFDVLWTGFSVRNRWIVISADQCTSSPPEVRNEHRVNILSEQRLEVYKDQLENPSRPKRAPPPPSSTSIDDNVLLSQREPVWEPSFVSTGTPDWTVARPQGELSPHIILARSIDWAATPLGDMSTWSREFRQIACLLMANPHPAALFWGDELTMLYNKAYADTVAGV